MLFLIYIYINELPLVLSHSCADINNLSHVDRWCQHNHMSINSDKSNLMFISSRQNRRILQSNTEIPYHDSVIKSCSTVKLVCVTVNNSLSWNDHIETVTDTDTDNFIKMQYIYLYVITNQIISLN